MVLCALSIFCVGIFAIFESGEYYKAWTLHFKTPEMIIVSTAVKAWNFLQKLLQHKKLRIGKYIVVTKFSKTVSALVQRNRDQTYQQTRQMITTKRKIGQIGEIFSVKTGAWRQESKLPAKLKIEPQCGMVANCIVLLKICCTICIKYKLLLMFVYLKAGRVKLWWPFDVT